MALEILLQSSGPFLIVFREALEASLIIGILAAYLKKVGRKDLNKYLIIGSISAIILSIGLGALLSLTYGGLSGISAQLFEGTAAITATIILTYMIFWMARNSKKVSLDLHEKLGTAISKGYLVGVATIAFVAVAREGLETVLFLVALMGAVGASATLLGAVSGIAVVLGLTLLVMRGVYRLDLKKFFKYTSLILLVFASGLLGYGIHEFIESAEDLGVQLGALAATAYNINPPDAGNLLHEKGLIGSMLKALVGYDGNPEWLRVIVYWSYWLIVGSLLMKTYSSTTYTNIVSRLQHFPSKTSV